jgi:hypothetical protein
MKRDDIDMISGRILWLGGGGLEGALQEMARKERTPCMPELEVSSLYYPCNPNSFAFKTTAEIAEAPERKGISRYSW